MIPPNLQHYEVGAYLQAVGLVMRRYDLCADAAVQQPTVDLVPAMSDTGIDAKRAEEIATSLTLAEAIEFIEPRFTEV
jgi:hypothetical protein